MVKDPEVNLSGFSDEQIADMPLHAVTEVLGTDGLLRRFELEIGQFSDEEQAPMEKALEWATDLHSNDKRYREPAINHILRVAIRIIHHYEVRDIHVILAAILHDTVEDHTYEITGRSSATTKDALATIEAGYGADVSSLVGEVTNPEFELENKLEQYQDHVRQLLMEGDPRARIIKASDFTDNALGLIYMPAEGASYRAKRYATLPSVFKEAIVRTDTPLSVNAKAHILKQMEETERRLNLLLSYGSKDKISRE